MLDWGRRFEGTVEMTQESQSSTKAAAQDAHSGIAEPMPQDVRAGGIKPTPQDARAAQELLDFIGECPSMFHTTSTIEKRLTAAGFTYLPETQPWNIEQGGAYYTTRNNSSVIAFKVGTSLDNYHFQITASHGDSPTFKVKSNAELTGPGESQRLNVEVYGGAVDYTWFDRPLGIAGRVMVKNGNRVESLLYESAEPLVLIPSMPPHIQRDINQQFSPNRQVDLCPLFSAGALGKSTFDAIIADELGISKSDIVARDLFLVNRQQPCIWGAAGEFASSPKFDDLACAYTALEAFLAAENDRSISVFACFDNEEVGSNTKQGAMSTLLADTLSRLNAALGHSCEDLRCAIAKSMLVSCDNAHAVNPNHPERFDEGNRVFLNRGIVVKEAANQKYCTDAFSRAAFCAICDNAEIPYQAFANRSDSPGGSTLGNLSNTQVSMHGVDVGLPQLAMHSSFETIGVRDVTLATRALKAFYAADLRIDGADSIELG